MLSSRVQETSTEGLFETGLASSQMVGLNSRNLFLEFCLPGDRSEVRQIKWLKMTDLTAGQVQF